MSTLPFVFPVDGVMLTEAAGRRVGEDLQITCILGAQATRRCIINGVPCRPGTEDLRATITLKDYRTTLVARDHDSGEETRIEVFFLRRGHRKYRFSLDDNIWFLQNLARQATVYRSMFEDPYLKLLKTMHDRYGTKFHVNIYGYYYDKAEDIFLHRYAGGLQRVPLDQVNDLFDTFAKQHPLYTWIELCVHEQYFYPDYVNYMPDYDERFDAAIRWCVEHGYEPAFIADVMEF